MAKSYDVASLLAELEEIVDTLPEGADKNIIKSLAARANGPYLPYNRILELYNKYIAVPAAVPAYRHNGAHRK